jgi:uncharacterized protein (TIGR00255 family)
VLLSMTGYADAHLQTDHIHVDVEVRAVNNRYLKVTLRAPEPYHLLEAEVEKIVRKSVRRGSLQVHLRCQRQTAGQEYQINAAALRSYLKQVREVVAEVMVGEGEGSLLAQVLALPGVVAEPGYDTSHLEQDWPAIEKTLTQALDRLQAMRSGEGQAMARELLAQRDHIGNHLSAVRDRAPVVVTAFRDRLLERVRGLLSELDVKLDRSDLIKEVSIFAERSDVQEEVVRLSSHLAQFQDVVKEEESAGRKLEFLTQEMFRETNTIGSKASDVEISKHVVEMKSALEKIREMIQNVE